MCMNVIQTAMELHDYSTVALFISKIRQAPHLPEKSHLLQTLPVFSGIIDLEHGLFKSAAKHFLSIPFHQNEFIWNYVSCRDVAIYGGLCALSSFSRKDLKSLVMESSDFKQFLESEPEMREILRAFYHSQFRLCFEILDKNEYMLDMFLNGPLDKLYDCIRNRAILQYCVPFIAVDIHQMALVFSCTVQEIETRVENLICEKMLDVKIDSHEKVLRDNLVDGRGKVFNEIVENGEEFMFHARYRAMRAKLVNAQIIIKPPIENK